MAQTCKVCEAPNRDEMEAEGLAALKGDISWSECARRLNLTHPKGVQNHMRNHWAAPKTAEEEFLEEQWDPLLDTSIEELTEQMALAPPEVKPFYAIAIRNLRGLNDTNPSQQHLINALKAIHEVTGMKMEQRLMLDFAKHHFGLAGPEAAAELEQHTGIIEAEVVEDGGA